jgi:hypothetical protein
MKPGQRKPPVKPAPPTKYVTPKKVRHDKGPGHHFRTAGGTRGVEK